MSREYAKRSRGGGGNLPLIIAIVGTVIVIAVIVYFLMGSSGGSSLFGGATDTPTAPPATFTPLSNTATPGPTVAPITPEPSIEVVLPAASVSPVIVEATATPAPAKVYLDCRISASSLNVREGPSLDYGTIGKVRYGESYKVLDETTKFVKIMMSNGVYGWIWEAYTVRGSEPLPPKPTSAPDPSMMKSATQVTSTTIKVVFTEGVYGNAAKTAAVPAAAFEVKEGTSAVAISAITLCQGGKEVTLTIGATSGGEISVTLKKNGVYNEDSEGTTAGTIKIGSSTDSKVPTASISNSKNKVTVSFSEAVFTNSDGTGSLTAADFSVYADKGSPTIGTVTQNGNSYDVVIVYTGISSPDIASTTFNVLGGTVFDASSNACAKTTLTFDYSAP